ncbi:MAG: hypothetical protein FP831_19625 [Anaerolineae bacterium]|nr:hypothetical protein [Anaerolineae bacterium]
MKNEVPVDQHENITNIVQRMMLYHDPEGGYAPYICPSCGFACAVPAGTGEHRVPFSCKTRFCPSCRKVHVDNWANDITKDILEVPHLHITLTTADSLHHFFLKDRGLLKELLLVGAQAVLDVVQSIHPGIRIGFVYTIQL